MPVSERQQQLWGALHAYIRNNGGWITSPPDAAPIRLECLLASDLPELLTNLGYKLRSQGTTEKFLPFSEELYEHGRHKRIARDQVKQVTVAIYEFDLP
jgi:hypothetical protein